MAVITPMINYIVRAIQAFFALIVLAIAASLISDYANSYSQFGYAVFVGVWTIVVAAILLVTTRFLTSLAHPAINLAIETLTWLFWLATWAAFAELVRHRGMYQRSKIGAVVAFAVLDWLLFTYTLFVAVMAFLDWRRGGGKNTANV